MSPNVEIIFGAGSWKKDSAFEGFDKIQQVVPLLEREGVTTIDTATLYGDSELILGRVNAAKTHIIDTKYPGGFASNLATEEEVLRVANESLKRLGMNKVNIYYLHSPDRRAPLAPQLSAITTLHKEGKIAHFGLSNFLPHEIKDVIRIAKENNFLLPTVYQGSYSAIGRLPETELFPLLREHGISFYAYSPIAGGFLAKDVDELLQKNTGRWDPESLAGRLYRLLYNKPNMLAGLKLWDEIANEAGVLRAEMAYRWVVHNSALRGDLGDKVVVGARNLAQLEESIAWVKKGPLAEQTVKRIEDIWRLVEGEATLDSYNDGMLKLDGSAEQTQAGLSKV
ncbi:NADP-dependent oxidoreductase domain-containing protein [Aspergillus crustosus]